MSATDARRREVEIFEQSEPVCAVDADFRITHVNEAQVQMSGVSREASVGRTLWEVWPPLTAPDSVFGQAYRRCMTERVEVRVEAFYAPLDTWFTMRIKPLQTGGLAIYAHDISEEKRLEQQLRTREEQLRLLVEHAPASIALFDRDMRYLAHSRRLLETFHLEQTSLVGQLHYEVFPFVPERWKEIHRAAIRDGQARRSAEDQFVRPDGSVEWVKWEVVPWRRGDGQVGGLVLFTENVTRVKQAEEQLRHAQKMEAVGRLAGGIAHDFNNVMTVILASASFIAEALPAGNEIRVEAEEITRAGERAASLTRQLMAFGSNQPSTPVPVDLNAVLVRNEAFFRRALPEDRRFKLKLELESGLPQCLVDPQQLDQALLNLVLNARDAMPAGGEIRLSTGTLEVDETVRASQPAARPGIHVVVSVTDTGEGMTSEVLEHLFEPFFTTKAFGKGTGLGLSMVYGVVQQHGGSVRVRSAPGEGATISLSFPLARAPASSSPPKPVPPPARASPSMGRVLLVEDEPQVRRVVAAMLARLGFEVLEAEDGEAALRVIQQHPGPLALTLTDVKMPRLDGPSLAERLRALRPEVPVLFMSGYTGTEGNLPGLVPAGAALLSKPFTREALERALLRLLPGFEPG